MFPRSLSHPAASPKPSHNQHLRRATNLLVLFIVLRDCELLVKDFLLPLKFLQFELVLGLDIFLSYFATFLLDLPPKLVSKGTYKLSCVLSNLLFCLSFLAHQLYLVVECLFIRVVLTLS